MSELERTRPGGVESRKLEALLAQINDDLAGLYRCATAFIDAPRPDHAMIVMIAHAVREIANNLAYHLGQAEGVDLPASVDLNDSAQELAAVWRPEVAAQREVSSLTEGPDDAIHGTELFVSPRVAAAVEAVVRAATTAESSTARRRAYLAVGSESAVDNPTAKLLGKTWEFFMAHIHLNRSVRAGRVAEEELQKHFARFETIVSARIGSFFAVNQELSDILEIANTRKPIALSDPAPTMDSE